MLQRDLANLNFVRLVFSSNKLHGRKAASIGPVQPSPLEVALL